MIYRILADAVVVIHLLFVLFAVLGGLLVLKWKKIIWGHVPAVVWAIWVEMQGWICPLTPLENWLRRQAGDEGYQQGFIDHYILPILYPSGLTREWQIILGAIVFLLNLLIYSWIGYRHTARKINHALVPIAIGEG